VSNKGRLGLVAVAIAVAVAAFVIARPDDDDDDRQASAPATTEQQQTGTEPQTTATPPPEPAVERLRVRGGQPVGGVKELEFEKGDEVRLAVTADAPEHVHVHGYDLFEDVGPGQTARFRFEADIEGIFEIELEDSHEQIAELRVEP
jgi:FtsP/CotA-like multicopper oxidase with cupredoxin domain